MIIFDEEVNYVDRADRPNIAAVLRTQRGNFATVDQRMLDKTAKALARAVRDVT